MADARRGPDHRQLLETASEQVGYFNAAQARSAGFSKALVAHHIKSGRYIRVRRGLYRLRDYPSSPREDVMAAWLSAGAQDSAVSHESALDFLDLSDVVPEVIHLIVPRAKRYRAASPGIAIHTTTRRFGREDVTVRHGIRVTSAARSIVDAAEAGTAPEQIVAATNQAVRRGMATKGQLLELANGRGARVKGLIRQAVDQEPSG